MKFTKEIFFVFLIGLLFPVNSWAVTPTVITIPTIEPTETVVVLPTLEPTVITPEEIKTEAKDNLAIWFLAVTIGLLLIIIVAQAWPKSDDEIEK